ncbi:MAG: ABC transporter permease [Bacillota bacterium]
MSINDSIVITWALMAIRMTTPILLAAFGGMLTSRAGVFNLGLEGMMLFGAFFGYYGSLMAGSAFTGLLAAVAIGAILGLFLAFFAITLNVDQVITCIGINIVALGLTSYLSRVLLVGAKVVVAPTFPPISIPLLSDIPVLGPLLFSHSVLVYFSVLLLFFLHWLFYKTTIGLNLRALGQDAVACKTAGINIVRYKYMATIFSGVLASIGGAYITTVAVNRFLENIVEGRGWIALAAIIFGRDTPFGVYGACLLFGAAQALQMLLQVQGVQLPYRFALMIPYLVTMIALAAFSGKKKLKIR